MIELNYYLPSIEITNEFLKSEFPSWDDTKIQSKVGIKSRHVAGESETALDLAVKASEALLQDFERKEIDFLILCTQSPDYFLPTTACLLQDILHLNKTIGAFDFNLGCSGYVYGLAIAKGLIMAQVASNVLFVTSETYSKHIYKKDVANRSIFGDASTATLIRKDDAMRIGNFSLGTDGSGKGNLIVQNGGMRHPSEVNPQILEYGSGNYYTNNHLYMNGPEIFNFTIENIPDVIKSNLAANDITLNEVDFFIFHQANLFMLDYLRRKIGIPVNKFCVDFAETGNTVSNTIPIVLKKFIENGKIVKGNKVMLVGFGVGYSWGAVTIKI